MNTQTLFVIIGSVSGAYLWLVDTAIIKALKLGRFHLHLQYSVTLWCEYYGGMWKLFVHLNCYSGEKRFSYDCNECTKKGHFTKCLRSSSNPAGGEVYDKWCCQKTSTLALLLWEKIKCHFIWISLIHSLTHTYTAWKTMHRLMFSAINVFINACHTLYSWDIG